MSKIKKITQAEKLDECYDDMLEEISGGKSLSVVCKERGIKRDVFYKYKDETEERKDKYTRACEQRGDSYADKIDEIEEKLLNGEIDSSTAKVLIDSQKWKACKFYPKMFGDMTKTQLVDDKGKGINPFDEIYKAICGEKDYTR